MISNTVLSRSWVLVAALILPTLIGVTSATAQTSTPTPEQLEIYKNLPKDQQDAILKSTIGKSGTNSGKSSDRAVTMPTTGCNNDAVS